jgi:hypothetical protein
MNIIKQDANLFYNELFNIANKENEARNTRMPSVANTYMTDASFQTVENLSRNYARSGQQKFADPFAFNMKPNTMEYNDGRNLSIFKTLKEYAKRDKPDVITTNPLTVVGYY